MTTVGYTQEFIRKYDKLPHILTEEVKKKIQLFKDRKNHQRLKVHKLHGKYQGFFGFSIDRKNRIMFEWVSSQEARLHTVGDHSIYD
jgi:mRNA-degrading endonuclease YafQ of YafQ-DinJ toxin-antitoxin module